MLKFWKRTALVFSFLTVLLTSYPAQIFANEREDLENSIRESNCIGRAISQSCSYLANLVEPFFPDTFVSLALNSLTRPQLVRSWLRYIAFYSENKEFAQYDSEFGVYGKIPKDPVPTEDLLALLEKGKLERQGWENGKMSGAIYDGSEKLMQTLAENFESAILKDEQNEMFFAKDPIARNLAKTAFQQFQTSNPLHGSSFPLAVKAMRELGTMLAQLFHSQHAIANSGARESLRIALKAMKKRTMQRTHSQETSAYIMERSQTFVSNIADSLNIKRDDTGEADFLIVNIDSRIEFLLDAFIIKVDVLDLDTHFHFTNKALREMIQNNSIHHLKILFDLFPKLISISFDTAGLVYSGISATVFRDASSRLNAFESHVQWKGGMYPGINTSGSISGVDYIIAYILLLHTGMNNLSNLAKEKSRDAFEDKGKKFSKASESSEFSKNLVHHFKKSEPMNTSQVHDLLREHKQNSKFENTQWRDELETALIDLNLAVFEADSKDFGGRVTSGGTESIRVAMQMYSDRFRKAHPNHRPIFLMNEMAHIAFERHLKDIDAKIVAVETIGGAVNIHDLFNKIHEYKAENIAAIIASAPSYPFGAPDEIREISQIAALTHIGFHVDACLGGFLMQFVESNPLRIDFTNGALWEGVSSWSADLHKYGVTQKGLSFVGFRRSFISDEQYFPNTICSERTAANLEVGIACMLEIGQKGYQERANSIAELGKLLKQEIRKIDDIEIRGEPCDSKIPDWVIAFQLRDPLKHHTYTLGSFMKKMGWKLNQVGDYTLHIALTTAHTQSSDFLEKFVSDLQFGVSLLHKYPNVKQSSSVGAYGMAAQLTNMAFGKQTSIAWLELLVSLYAENIMTASKNHRKSEL